MTTNPIEFAGGRLSIDLAPATNETMPSGTEIAAAIKAIQEKLGSLAVIPAFVYANPEQYSQVNPSTPNAFLDTGHNLIWFSDGIRPQHDLAVNATTIFVHELLHRATMNIRGGYIQNVAYVDTSTDPIPTHHHVQTGMWTVQNLRGAAATQMEAAANAAKYAYPFDKDAQRVTEVINDLATFLVAPEPLDLVVIKDRSDVLMQIDNQILRNCLNSGGFSGFQKTLVTNMLSGDVEALKEILNPLKKNRLDNRSAEHHILRGIGFLYQPDSILAPNHSFHLIPSKALSSRR